jgi:hypothetical protein
MFSQSLVELYGYSVDFYGNLIEVYGNFIELYGHSVELYGALVELYGNPVEYYGTFVELYGTSVEYPKPIGILPNVLKKEQIYGWRLHSPFGWGVFGVGKDPYHLRSGSRDGI